MYTFTGIGKISTHSLLVIYLKIDQIWDDTPKLIHNVFVTETLFVISLTNHEKKFFVKLRIRQQ